MTYRFVLLALATTAAWAQGISPGDVRIRMTASQQSHMGVSSTVLELRNVPVTTEAVVRSVDPMPLARLDADLAATAAAVAASQGELQRTQGLAAQDQSASQQALEAARAHAAGDMANLELLQRRLRVEWGTYFAELPAEARGKLVDELTGNAAALLRADAPAHPDGVAGTVLVTADPGGVPVAAVTLGLSGSADPGMQTVGVFCVVRGPAAAALRPGRTLAGEIETGRVVTGVVIPRSAVVRLDGADWVYVQEDADTFVRHAIVGGRPLRDGWLVAGGMPPGVAVVDRGAGSLIALERADAATGPE